MWPRVLVAQLVAGQRDDRQLTLVYEL